QNQAPVQPGLAEPLTDQDLEGLLPFSDDEVNDTPTLHDAPSSPASGHFTHKIPFLAGSEGLTALGDEDSNRLSAQDSESSSSSSDDDDEEEAQPSGALVRSRTLQSPVDFTCLRHNRELHNVLHALVTTGPTAVRQRSALHTLLRRPILTDDYDVILEEALWLTMIDARKICRNAGDKSMLIKTFAAVASAWKNLELGPLPNILRSK
ncbi:hypothetical protein FRC01_011795, partial [Tulasnella sp. 417]